MHDLDVRFDLSFGGSLHGVAPPQRVAGNPQEPWLIWSPPQQITEADAVPMYCTSGYAGTDSDCGTVRARGWNWPQQDEEDRIAVRTRAVLGLDGDRPGMLRLPLKFIPIATNRYHGDRIFAFVRGATYLSLSNEGAFDALPRRICLVRREYTRVFLKDVSGER